MDQTYFTFLASVPLWLALCTVFLLLFFLVSWLRSPAKLQLAGRHVLIGGGSQGIGLELAKLVVAEGASVSVVARKKETLAQAKAEIEKCIPSEKKASVKVVTMSGDLTSWESTRAALHQACAAQGSPVSLLLCAVGIGTSGTFEEMDMGTIEGLMRTNWLAPVHLIKAALPSLKEAPRPAQIVLFSSQAAQMGVYGYAAYSSAKCALKGLAEVLEFELAPYEIRLSLCFPPDTATPGFEVEEQSKPELTRILSEGQYKAFAPQAVARTVLRGIKRGDFQISVGMDGWLLKNLNAASLPQPYLSQLVVESLLAGLLRIVVQFYKADWHRTIRKWHQQKKKQG